MGDPDLTQFSKETLISQPNRTTGSEISITSNQIGRGEVKFQLFTRSVGLFRG
jgi:hypothetical protein